MTAIVPPRRPDRHGKIVSDARRRIALGYIFAAGLAVAAQAATPAEQARWRRDAEAVTITRDDWGIAHIHGRTDADAVFGMLYAQAEDDFNRAETNYINAMGPLWCMMRRRTSPDLLVSGDKGR